MKNLSRFASSLLLTLFALLPLAGCGTTGVPGGVGAVGSVVAGDIAPDARPSLLVRYDADTFVAWARAGAEASIYWRGEPRAYVMPPARWMDGRAVVRVRSLDYAWEGRMDEPLPSVCAPMFSADERTTWKLAFFQVP